MGLFVPCVSLYSLYVTSHRRSVQVHMAHADATRGRKSPFSPAADFDRESSEDASSQTDAAAPAKTDERKTTDERKAVARSSGRTHRRETKRSQNVRRGRDPSYSYNRRRRGSHRRRQGHERRRRRREHKSKSVDKRRRSESKAPAAKAPSKSAARPLSPHWDESKPRTRACGHCGYEITTPQSGRLQHQWASRNCLTWQFWNQLDENIKKQSPHAAWDKAKKAAQVLYERRRMQAAPFQAEGELPPPPPLVLRSRSSIARRAEDLEEMEVVPLEEEPLQKPTRLLRSQSAAPGSTGAGPSDTVANTEPDRTALAAAAVASPAVPAVPAGLPSSTPAGVGQKQQIVININST